MTSAAAATELLPRPTVGRVFTSDSKVRLGDVDREGQLRLDATARFMQDVATDDANDAQLDRRYGWLVRRTMIDTVHPARLGETIATSTWCAGIGRSWAERRTQIVGERGALIDAVSLWVQVDPIAGRPARIADDFTDAYAATAGGRTVSSRLSLAAPTSLVDGKPWVVRRTDLDPFGHVNNAATWSLFEEFVALDEPGRRVGRAELEYPAPIEHGDDLGVVGFQDSVGTSFWVIRDGAVCASARWSVSEA